MGKTANKQMICEVLMETAKEDKDMLRSAVIPEEVDLLHHLQIRIRNNSWKPGLQNRIWSVLQPDLQNVERNLMRFHRHASFLQEAMSSVKWMLHILTRM